LGGLAIDHTKGQLHIPISQKAFALTRLMEHVLKHSDCSRLFTGMEMTPRVRGRVSSALSCICRNPNAGGFLEFPPMNLSPLHKKLAEPWEKKPEGVFAVFYSGRRSERISLARYQA